MAKAPPTKGNPKLKARRNKGKSAAAKAMSRSGTGRKTKRT